MQEPSIRYDEMSDTLTISFAPGVAATGIELNDHLLLRIDKKQSKAVGLTMFDYSILAQKTETGPRSLPLTGLDVLSDELRQTVIRILLSPPVSDLLSLSTYTPNFIETWPIAALRPLPLAA